MNTPVFTSIGVVLIGYLLEQKCFFHEPVKVVFIFFSQTSQVLSTRKAL